MAKRRKIPIQHGEIVEKFAERLREIRLSRGMTQVELARQANVTVSYISRLESAGAAPGIDLVDRLAKALGTNATDLLPTVTPPDPLPVLRDQGKRLFDLLFQTADRETWLRLNPLMALLVEAASKRA